MCELIMQLQRHGRCGQRQSNHDNVYLCLTAARVCSPEAGMQAAGHQEVAAQAAAGAEEGG